MSFDWQILQMLNNFAGKNSVVDGAAIFFAEYSGYILLLILCLLLIKNYKKNRGLFLISLISGIISRFVFAEIIRHIYFRPRPFVENTVNLLIIHKPSASFPSGHASFYFALATGVYFINKKLGVFSFLLAFLMGLSRIYCGVHWPSDILAGAVLGILVSWVMFKVYKKRPK